MLSDGEGDRDGEEVRESDCDTLSDAVTEFVADFDWDGDPVSLALRLTVDDGDLLTLLDAELVSVSDGDLEWESDKERDTVSERESDKEEVGGGVCVRDTENDVDNVSEREDDVLNDRDSVVDWVFDTEGVLVPVELTETLREAVLLDDNESVMLMEWLSENDTENDSVAEPDPEGVGGGVAVPVSERDSLRLIDFVTLRLFESENEPLTVGVGGGVIVVLPLSVTLLLPDGDALSVGVGGGVIEGVLEALCVGEAEKVGDCVAV